MLEPLDLRATGFTPAEGLSTPRPCGYRHGPAADPVGYGEVFFDATGYGASWAGAAGDVYSTLDDLALAIGPLATEALLAQPMRDELHRWIETGAPGIRYGFHLGDRAGALGHSGDVPGFSATAVYLPASGTTIVVLANLSNSRDRRIPAVELEQTVRAALGAP